MMSKPMRRLFQALCGVSCALALSMPALASTRAQDAPNRPARSGVPLPSAVISDGGDIQVEINGVKGNSGSVVILLYTSSAGFPTKTSKAKRAYMATVSGGKARRTISGLAPGTYALSVYHDANGNGELDTNWIGMPKEGVGASNNAKGTMGPPKFKDAKFSLGSAGITQSIKLTYL